MIHRPAARSITRRDALRTMGCGFGYLSLASLVAVLVVSLLSAAFAGVFSSTTAAAAISNTTKRVGSVSGG